MSIILNITEDHLDYHESFGEYFKIKNSIFKNAKIKIANEANKAGISKKVIQYSGDAIKIIDKLNFEFDLVFIDADKENYPLYFDLIIDKVKSGGVIIADNILWSGKILDKVEDDDLATKSILEFNEKVNSDKRVETVILPVRDGLSFTRKI